MMSFFLKYNFFKRFMDISFSILALLLTSPILIITSFIIKTSSKGPILFKQTRIGLNAKQFTIYKFRTMFITSKKSDHFNQTFIGDKDIIPLGNIIRRLKIDEIPQFYNVLIGQMSIIGPRPCLPSTHKLMPKWALQRFSTKPGITGLAQINGGINLSWPERWIHDKQYIKNKTFLKDLEILIKTCHVIIFGDKKVN